MARVGSETHNNSFQNKKVSTPTGRRGYENGLHSEIE